MVHLVTLPFRLFFGLIVAVLCLPFVLLFLPFLLLRVVVKTALALILVPFVLITAAIGIFLAAVGLVFALLLPLLPFAVIAFLIWALVKPRSVGLIPNP